MPKSTYLDNKLLDHALGTTTFTKPTNVYVALYTSSPTNADTGTEVTGGSYARQVAAFAAASAGATNNSGALAFTNMPACTITHFGIRDASAAGNLLYWNSLTASKTVNAGDTVNVAISALAVSEA